MTLISDDPRSPGKFTPPSAAFDEQEIVYTHQCTDGPSSEGENVPEVVKRVS